jgi:hypothetical protein
MLFEVGEDGPEGVRRFDAGDVRTASPQWTPVLTLKPDTRLRRCARVIRAAAIIRVWWSGSSPTKPVGNRGQFAASWQALFVIDLRVCRAR